MVEFKPKVCYPSECGIPKYYPGSPLTLSSNDANNQKLIKKIVGGTR